MDFSTNMQSARTGCVWCIIWMMCVTSGAWAQVELPLGGYVRAGKCIAVRVDGSIRQISAEGAVPTYIAAGVSGIVPMLVLTDAPGTLRGGSIELPLRPLSVDQRLVGVIGTDSSIASLLFPQGLTPITVPLASPPPMGSLLAWEALDAIILDAAPLNVEDYLSAGITVAVRSPINPDRRWAWEKLNDYWVLRADVAGPKGAIGGEVAYLPTQSWAPGRPDGLRRRIVLLGVLVLLLLMAATLIPGNRAIPAIVGIVVVCAIAIEVWRRGLPQISTERGTILVHSPRMTQQDDWTYLAAGASGGEGALDLARPILASTGHAQQVGLQIHADSNDRVVWRYALPPNARLAAVYRAVRLAGEPPVAQTPITSPMFELARQSYLAPGSLVRGQIPGGGWNAILVVRE